jgi:hypothetical protein
MREQTKVYLNRIISVMMNYFNLISQTLSIKKNIMKSKMLIHNPFNFSSITFKFCKTIILMYELTKTFHNLIIMKSLKFREINTKWKMKIEEDNANK